MDMIQKQLTNSTGDGIDYGLNSFGMINVINSAGDNPIASNQTSVIHSVNHQGGSTSNLDITWDEIFLQTLDNEPFFDDYLDKEPSLSRLDLTGYPYDDPLAASSSSSLTSSSSPSSSSYSDCHSPLASGLMASHCGDDEFDMGSGDYLALETIGTCTRK